MSQEKLFAEDAAPAVAGRERSAEAPRLRVANRTQIEWRAVDVDSVLPPEHEVRTVWSAVERLDLSRFYEPIVARGSAPGRGATDPKLLVALWVFATGQGVGSGRELAVLCREHIAYQWICGGVSVNYHTLSDFRVAHGAAVDELITQVLGALTHHELLVLYRTAQDGTKVRASAGAASFRRQHTLHECLKEARNQVEHTKRAAQEPDGQRTARQRGAQERAARERVSRLERALAEMATVQAKAAKDEPTQSSPAKESPDTKQAGACTKKKPAPKEPRVSTTDPQARVMKMADGGFRPAYNVQLATDPVTRVIVGVKVTNHGTDYGEMSPMMDEIQRRTGQVPSEQLVDGGYVNKDEIAQLAEKGIAVFAPVRKPKDPTVDPHKARADEHGAIGEWRERMALEPAREVYKERAATAESVNATLKDQGLAELTVRGLSKVTTVTLWAVLAYNLSKAVQLGWSLG